MPKTSIKHGMSIRIGNENIQGLFLGLDNATSFFSPSFSCSVRLKNYMVEPGIKLIREWDNRRTRTMTILGLGIFRSKKFKNKDVNRYFGLRLNGVLFTSEYDGEQGDEGLVQMISPTYGIEYFSIKLTTVNYFLLNVRQFLLVV